MSRLYLVQRRGLEHGLNVEVQESGRKAYPLLHITLELSRCLTCEFGKLMVAPAMARGTHNSDLELDVLNAVTGVATLL